MSRMGTEPCKPRQASSFVVDDVNASIMFLPCGLISFNPSDVTYRYCGKCKRFISKNFLDLTGRQEGRQV